MARLDVLFQVDERRRLGHIGGTLYQETTKTSRMLDVWEIDHIGSVYIGDEWLLMSLSLGAVPHILCNITDF